MNNLKKRLGAVFFIILFFVNLSAPTVLAAEKIITVTGDNFVADTLNGVDAIYRPGSSDGSSQTYSCAAFVKKYYKEVYDVSLYNLFYNKAPKSYGGETINKVSDPQIGDIAACTTDHSTTHWAIVKDVNEDGTVTLIEQNWKWTQGGKTVTCINRTVELDSIRLYRLSN